MKTTKPYMRQISTTYVAGLAVATEVMEVTNKVQAPIAASSIKLVATQSRHVATVRVEVSKEAIHPSFFSRPVLSLQREKRHDDMGIVRWPVLYSISWCRLGRCFFLPSKPRPFLPPDGSSPMWQYIHNTLAGLRSADL